MLYHIQGGEIHVLLLMVYFTDGTEIAVLLPLMVYWWPRKELFTILTGVRKD